MLPFLRLVRAGHPTRVRRSLVPLVRTAVSRAREAPSVRRSQRKLQIQQQQPRTASSPSSLSVEVSATLIKSLPLTELKSALSDGLINVPFSESVTICRQLIRQFDEKRAAKKEVKLSVEVSADRDKISQVAFVLLRSPLHNRIAHWAILMLHLEGDLRSKCFIIHERMRNTNHPFYKTIPSALLKLADEDVSTEPLLAVLSGKLQEQAGNLNAAATIYKEAMEVSKPVEKSKSFDALFPVNIPSPWEAYYSVMKEMGEEERALEALTIGVTEYQSPLAHRHLLPHTLKSGDLAKYEEYLTKAAISNDPDASTCLQLGNLYLKIYLERTHSKSATAQQPQDNIAGVASHISTAECKLLAVEWCRLAVSLGNARAALVLAGILRQSDAKEDGLEFLKIAEGDSVCARSAAELRELWQDASYKPDLRRDLMSQSTQL